MSGTWRVGNALGRHVYRDGTLVGMMDTPEVAAEIVRKMNAEPPKAEAEETELAEFLKPPSQADRDRARVAMGERIAREGHHGALWKMLNDARRSLMSYLPRRAGLLVEIEEILDMEKVEQERHL